MPVKLDYSAPPSVAPAVAAPISGTRLPATLVWPIVLGTLLNALNSSMIAVALVAIEQSFASSANATKAVPVSAHGTELDAMWLVSGLYLATAVGQPTMGRLADRFGARRIFCIGLAIVLAASVLAPFAPSLGWLIASRIVLGLGTSAAYPAGMTMIRTWSRRHANGATPTGGLGAISVAAQVAVAFGPPLGGALVELAGWRAIFWVNVPIVLASFITARLWLPKDERITPTTARGTWRQAFIELDVPGIVLFVLALASLLLFLQSIARLHGAGAQPQWLLLAAGVLIGTLLILFERRTLTPFIDVRMLVGNRPLMGTYVRCVATYAVFYAIFYALPIWLQEVRHLSAASAGLLMLPIAGIGTVATVIATRVADRSGARRVLIYGSSLLCVGGIVMSLITHTLPVWSIALLSVVFGIPNGFNNLGNQATLYRSAPHDKMGAASGLYRTAQYVGGSLSFALVGLALGRPASDSGLHGLAIVLAATSFALLMNAVTSKHIEAGSPILSQSK
ncbi:MFS transporter [Trinickia fusca]|uniref:MFS transporter n=1 Tax=Trinickia fusca TaxID=2419777 RepID=A0A494X7X3_9BURK|nr:MFS transporter [Trinickia fusca]